MLEIIYKSWVRYSFKSAFFTRLEQEIFFKLTSIYFSTKNEIEIEINPLLTGGSDWL